MTQDNSASTVYSDKALINGIVEKNSKIIKSFIELHSHYIFTTCIHFIPNKEDAEDLTQTIFIKLFDIITSFEYKSTLKTWIYRITVTECLQEIRRRKRKKRFAFFSPINDAENAQSIDQLPDINFEEKESLKQIYASIDSLPENQRTAFTLQNIKDLSTAEIAEIMDLSISSIESLLFRARKNLKEKIKSAQGSS